VLQLQELEAEPAQVAQVVAQVQVQVQVVVEVLMAAATEVVKLLFKQVQAASVQLELSITQQVQVSLQLM
jgi:hypothetical protein